MIIRRFCFGYVLINKHGVPFSKPYQTRKECKAFYEFRKATLKPEDEEDDGVYRLPPTVYKNYETKLSVEEKIAMAKSYRRGTHKNTIKALEREIAEILALAEEESK